MDIRQFRSELAEAFVAAGFERRPIPRSKDSIWILPGREIERSFWQHSMRRPWGFLLSGSLAIDVPAFRNWLNESFPTDQHGILHGSVLSRHIANEANLFFAVENEEPPYREWTDQVRLTLAALPDTVEGLLNAEREPQRLRLVWGGLDPQKAWTYFKAWAQGHAPNHPPPHMLPTGPVVGTPANDRA